MKTVLLAHDSLDLFRADYERNLRKARAFVAGAEGLAQRERCTLEIVHPRTGVRFQMAAEAVWIGPEGIGLELVGLDAARKAQLDEFANADAPAPAESAGTAAARNVHERIRGLSTREREEVARHGSMPERVALERAYGGAVWEGLLQNPQLSPPEVARIARNGTLPKPLVATIVNSASWLASPEVQRALLSNPRCSGSHLERVLRSLSCGDLSRLAQQCPYRAEVRTMARQLAVRK